MNITMPPAIASAAWLKWNTCWAMSPKIRSTPAITAA